MDSSDQIPDTEVSKPTTIGARGESIPPDAAPIDDLPFRRSDPHVARALIERLYPDPNTRRRCLDLFVEAILRAHTISPSSWGVTLHEHEVRLNVGPLEAIDLRKGQLDLTVDKAAVEPEQWRRIEEHPDLVFKWNGEPFQVIPTAYGVQLPVASLEELVPLVHASHDALVERAAGMVKTRMQYYESHSPGVIEYLREELKEETPDPDYQLPSVTAANVWLFQAIPNFFDLARDLPTKMVGDTDHWTASRYRDQMRPGDVVLLWQGGEAAGLYAVGELIGPPFKRSTEEVWPDKEQHPLSEWAVPFRYTHILAQPIEKRELQQHPVLQNLLVLRAPQGTNFKVTPEQWRAFQELLGTSDGTRVWIEKTLVHGRPDRQQGEYALGQALWSPRRASNGADVYRFMRDVRPGDIVLHLTDNTGFTGVSRVAGPLEEFGGVLGTPWEGECYLVRLQDFTKLKPPLLRDTFFASPYRERLIQLIDAGVKNLFYDRKPAFHQGAYLTPASPELAAILDDAYHQVAGKSLFTKQVPPKPPLQPSYTLIDCARDTGLPEELLGRWVRAIRRKGQAILYGPPGTGKTFVAEQLAQHLVAGGQGLCELVQFHPSYGYEDFVLGIRPVTANGSLTYEPQDGRFVDFCDRARSRNGRSVLIIDEINRANLSQVFGELMYLLEYRDSSVTLAGGRVFTVPNNVIILGTMNTADRSIALMDYALRRRFAFLRLDPDYDLLTNFLTTHGFAPDALVAMLKAVNATIGDPNYHLGVSFFLRDDLAEHLPDIWRMEVEPYLEEYFFDQRERADPFAWEQIAQRVLP